MAYENVGFKFVSVFPFIIFSHLMCVVRMKIYAHMARSLQRDEVDIVICSTAELRTLPNGRNKNVPYNSMIVIHIDSNHMPVEVPSDLLTLP